jgi:hypothetical protein
MDREICCHGNCAQGDECPRRRIDTPGDTRLGFMLVAIVCLAFWTVFFALLVWDRS